MGLGFSIHRGEILAATCEPLLDIAEHHNCLDVLLLDHPPKLGTGVTSVLIWGTFGTLFSLITSLSIGFCKFSQLPINL